MTTLRNLLFTATLCVFSGASARAGILSLDFDLNTLTALPGQTVTARGTVTNLTASTVDINSCSVTLPGEFTTDSCGIFLSLTGAPLFLGIGESATVDLFTFTADPNFWRSLRSAASRQLHRTRHYRNLGIRSGHVE